MTVEEFIKQTLCSSGIEEATGVRLTFKDGHTLTIHSDDHPALQNNIEEGDKPQVQAVQSAQGGFVYSI